MSLLQPNQWRKGNPNWVKGKSGNPSGKPTGTVSKKNSMKTQERLRRLHKTHPVDQLVDLAQRNHLTNPKLAAEIWTRLLEYCEPTKKPVETVPEKPTTPEQSKENVEAMLKLLEDTEGTHDQRRTESSSDTTGLGKGTADVQAETSTKEDLPGN